jgi:hypothetical protein
MDEQLERATSALSWIKVDAQMKVPARTLAAVELFVSTGKHAPSEPEWVTEARVGIMKLSGSSPSRLADQLVLFFGRLRHIGLRVPAVEEIIPFVGADVFSECTSSSYVRVLNAYLRGGKELLIELGVAPAAYITEKFAYDAQKDNVLATDSGGTWKATFGFGPLRFSCWEASHKCIGFPLREFGDSLPFGVHFSHIIGISREDHISEMIGARPSTVRDRKYPTFEGRFPKYRRYFVRGGCVHRDGYDIGRYAATSRCDIDSMRTLFTMFGKLFGCVPSYVKCIRDTLDARSK